MTLGPTPFLDGKHTIFGRVKSGMRVVQRLGSVAVDAQDRYVAPSTAIHASSHESTQAEGGREDSQSSRNLNHLVFHAPQADINAVSHQFCFTRETTNAPRSEGVSPSDTHASTTRTLERGVWSLTDTMLTTM